MPRRRRMPKRSRIEVDDFAVGAGLFFDLDAAASDVEVREHVEAVRAWYGDHGEDWEREQAEQRPGQRSWAWWTFVAGRKRPAGEAEALRLLADAGHLDAQEVGAIFQREARFALVHNTAAADHPRLYGVGAVHGEPAELLAGRVLREAGYTPLPERVEELRRSLPPDLTNPE